MSKSSWINTAVKVHHSCNDSCKGLGERSHSFGCSRYRKQTLAAPGDCCKITDMRREECIDVPWSHQKMNGCCAPDVHGSAIVRQGTLHETTWRGWGYRCVSQPSTQTWWRETFSEEQSIHYRNLHVNVGEKTLRTAILFSKATWAWMGARARTCHAVAAFLNRNVQGWRSIHINWPSLG